MDLPEPVPIPTSPVRYMQGQYPATGMQAHHLRDFVRLLDEAGVPDDAPAYVYGAVNRGVGMVTMRVDLADDEELLARFAGKTPNEVLDI